MTAIAIWANYEVPANPGLWIAADSRVRDSFSSLLIDDATKILSLTVICRSPGRAGFFSEVYHAHTYGYCFAGSTLMGQNAYLALGPLLSNLISPTCYIPSMADIARHMLSYLRLTFDAYKERVGQPAMVEVGLFGHCQRTGRLSMFHIGPGLEAGIYTMKCTAHVDMQDKDFVYLGDHKEEMSAKIAAAFMEKTMPGRPSCRIPKHIIQDHIDNPAYQSIGGDLQLGIADRFGFHPYWGVAKPSLEGQSEANFTYLGRELTSDLLFVGEARVGGSAML